MFKLFFPQKYSHVSYYKYLYILGLLKEQRKKNTQTINNVEY